MSTVTAPPTTPRVPALRGAADLAGRIGLFHTIGMPEETAPQRKAQIGGNQVIGLISRSMARGSGNWRVCMGRLTLML